MPVACITLAPGAMARNHWDPVGLHVDPFCARLRQLAHLYPCSTLTELIIVFAQNSLFLSTKVL